MIMKKHLGQQGKDHGPGYVGKGNESLATLAEDSDDEVPTAPTGHGPERSQNLESSPNRPHPSLEYPPLYFALKRWPGLSKRIEALYKFRWHISYPLQKRLPFSNIFRKIGIRASWGEALLVSPFILFTLICIVFTVILPDVIITGKMARFGLIGALVFGQKTSLLTVFLGIPFDRALFYHKTAGYNAVVNGLLHFWAFAYRTTADSNGSSRAMDNLFSGSVHTSGSFLLIFLLSLFLSSVKPVRRALFEVFYFFHIAFILGMVCCAYFHSGILIPCLAFLTSGIDMLFRKVVMARFRYPQKASIKVIGQSVVEVIFPKMNGFDYNPGQYIYIAIPELSWFEAHPFSISSSPKQSTVTLHIRRAGDWTDALHRLALQKSEVSILIEGPYGNLSMNLFGSDRYKYVVLVCGGIGITPMQSVCNQLLYEHAKGRRNLENVKLVWVERDPVLMKGMSSSSSLYSKPDGTTEPALDMSLASPSGSLSLASQFLSMASPNQALTDAELETLYQSQFLDLTPEDEDKAYAIQAAMNDKDSQCGSSPFVSDDSFGEDMRKACEREEVSRGDTSEEDVTSVATSSFPYHRVDPELSGRKRIEEIADIRVHITGGGMNEQQHESNHHLSYVRHGRPQFREIFQETAAAACATGDSRVAVLVCGPASIAAICRKVCLQLSNRDVCFDYHEEGFA